MNDYDDQQNETSNKQQQQQQINVSINNGSNINNELTLAAIKDYLVSKGGKVKYNELYSNFKDQITDSSTEKKFQEFLSNLAVKKYNNDSNTEEWVLLKKVYKETISPNNAGFFASKLQKTKQSLTKFSNTLHHHQHNKNKDKENQQQTNKSLNLSNSSLISASGGIANLTTTTSYSATNLSLISNDSNNSCSNLTRNDSNKKYQLTNSNPANSNNISTDTEKESIEPVANSSELEDKATELVVNNEHTIGVKSVKEHAKKLNRLSTESELKNLNEMQQKQRNNSTSSTTSKDYPTKSTMKQHIEIEPFDLANLKPQEKEWILICSRGDYMEMARILSKTPYLAQKKDPFTTCAHWACKYGNEEILKLIASTLENDTKTNPKSIRINNLVNSRTGYTCLHVAYTFNHGEMAPLLKAYGAEGLTDYSGKQAIEYSKPVNFLAPDVNEFRGSCIDLNNDANTLIKRSSSILVSKEKEKETKELFGIGTLRNYEKRTFKLQKNVGDLNRPNLTSSPLAAIDTCNNTNNQMPPPNFVLRNKGTKLNNNETNENSQTEESTLGESKENIFI